ncbi:hypothetical protein T492DRAFT_866047 [Pavlovales sp. CCMP2436]|nr:hypothetical protein T492DRAFT_866047 [Pavlovales sp. CCMP2436]
MPEAEVVGDGPILVCTQDSEATPEGAQGVITFNDGGNAKPRAPRQQGVALRRIQSNDWSGMGRVSGRMTPASASITSSASSTSTCVDPSHEDLLMSVGTVLQRRIQENERLGNKREVMLFCEDTHTRTVLPDTYEVAHPLLLSRTMSMPTIFGVRKMPRPEPSPMTFDVPSVHTIVQFLRNIWRKARLTPHCVIICLVYVDRLEAKSEEGVLLHARSWRPIIFSALLLASKVWHDVSYWNSDFSTICPIFTVRNVNKLERTILELLQYDTIISSSQYAQYYFSLRQASLRQQDFSRPSEDSTAKAPDDNFRTKLMLRMGVPAPGTRSRSITTTIPRVANSSRPEPKLPDHGAADAKGSRPPGISMSLPQNEPVSKTYAHQDSLPDYPVPSLEETSEVYLRSLRPLLTDEQYEHSQAVVADFVREGTFETFAHARMATVVDGRRALSSARPDRAGGQVTVVDGHRGQAHELQQVLLDRAGEHRNWIEEWWLRMAYLMTRETHAVHVNWFGVFPDWGVKLSPVQAAALMMISTLEFKAALDAQELPPETMRGQPLCMHQYSLIFGSTRIPQEGEDVIETHSDSKHIVVFRNDHVFSVRPYHPDGTMFSVAEAAAMLQQVIDMSSSVLEETEEPSVSVLTAMNRDKWAAVRTDMIERSALNRASIREIETALYCLSFEDSSPTSKQEVAQACLAGDGRNKWFDKSFTTLVFDNGRGGCNAEHSPVDAMVCVAMFDYVVKRTRDKVILEQAHLFGPLPRSAVPPPTKLKFELWPQLSMAIETASVELTQLIR